jgi:hypothetical protein
MYDELGGVLGRSIGRGSLASAASCPVHLLG